MRRTLTALVAGAVLIVMVGAPAKSHSSAGRPDWLAERLAREVTGERAYRHLVAWQRAANRGGSRATGTAGLALSAGYLVRTLHAAGYRVTRQPVPYQDLHVDVERADVHLPGAGPKPLPVLMTRWSPNTPRGGVLAPIVTPPATGDPARGCEAADYAGLPVQGGIVVLARASCGHVAQQRVAAELGAVAILTYLPTPRPDNIYRLQVPIGPGVASIPMGNLSQRDGERLAGGGAGARLRLELRGHQVTGTTENVLAETRRGRSDRVVMVGAHLDSVAEGPGINDNGSSAAAVLETALRLARYQDRVRNRVRFAWWGAEELISVGSAHYVRSLHPGRRGDIALYLNYELIGSPNFARFVIDGDDSDHLGTGSGPAPPGSGAIEAAIKNYYTGQRLAHETADISAIGSDHRPFMDAGVPIGGMFGGTFLTKSPEQAARYGGVAGDMYDPCYHQRCDALPNLHGEEFGRNTRAIAWTVGRFARDASDVGGTRSIGGAPGFPASPGRL